ncbi:substrate-binding periplasmic protein [Vibrio cholerae]|uniref:substrate-binding periplasmic protein n=1 Tax=Vibrio cholerae TaxID=666 RepID=UPI00021A9D5A|nr:transporter substrate-binding domain-containing protein [Vibrio cholerae]EGS62157.1 extracellular solute-binding protein, family 3 [Vibrio cholerae HC-02A1]EKF9156273.1 transporter substrate-binding domain-containing protein [Vibrio cholerae]EKF9387308.1 transporter substrate-binding domain-containing protein [Vibrio cholerae]EKF9823434.1 transporter substrate-binding domain-containing protein [Vibrio cholerae]EKG50971.1 extracellular solute-binding protein, family 3 [Vibrio cholerae HC-50A
MQWRFCLTTVLGVVLSFSPSVKVQAQGLESLTYYTENYPPLNFAQEDGKPAGIAVDLLLEAAAAVNVTLNLDQIFVQPWPRSYRSALLKQDGVLFSTTRTTHRENLFNWVGPIADIKVVVLARKSSQIKVNDPIELGNYPIGVIRDDIGEQQLLQLGVPRESMVEGSTVSSLAEQLLKKRIDLLAYDERTALWWMSQDSYPVEEFETVYVLMQGSLYYAFNKNIDKSVLNDLQKGIELIKNSVNENGVTRSQAILDKY